MRRTIPGLLALSLIVAACSGGNSEASDSPLVISGIPDQDVELLEVRFGGIADYLSEELDIPVVYQPAVDYAAIVTAFGNGDIQLGWFGALTGVQARLETPGANVLAQRPVDGEFVSTFIINAEHDAESLADLVGLSLTFGSESSTSGHVMPRYYLQQAGIDPEEDLAQVSYSGSHHVTYRLVESGSFDVGVLSTTVWDRAVADGQVDTSKVRPLEATPPYANYHWLAHPDIDEEYGPGTTDRILTALLAAGEDPVASEYVAMFEDDRFIAADVETFGPLEEIATELGLVGE